MTLVKKEWLLCPVCGSKTRIQIRQETELKYFPLFCPKCRQETLIHVRGKETTLVMEEKKA